jgi:hypothetical protein
MMASFEGLLFGAQLLILRMVVLIEIIVTRSPRVSDTRGDEILHFDLRLC